MKRVFNRKNPVIIALVCIILITAYASAEVFVPMYMYIGNVSCQLSFSGANAVCYANANTEEQGYTVSLTASLYKSKSGNGWTKVDSWSANGSGLFGVSIYETAKAVKGHKYKLSARIVVKNSMGEVVETTSITSPIKEYR